MTSPNACPELESLLSLVEGTLATAQETDLTQHLETCESCQEKLEELAAGKEAWAMAARHAGPVEVALEPTLQQILERCRAARDMTDSAEGAELPADFLEPPAQAGHLGRMGPYEVLEVTGRGGMGIVLKSFDPALHRIVAIKVLAPQLASNSTGRKRFIREAQAAAAIRDQHVVDIHAVGEEKGLPYLVMEFIAGISLQDKIEHSAPLAIQEILRIGAQTAAGLAAAHAQGLIHRDIKPANILLENGVERVKITDFGLARVVDDASVTQSGVVAGTPQYMAPEQARGEAIDHRVDLFSLGSVLYAMCIGRPPFRANTTLAVLKQVSDDTPQPIQELNPAIPNWLIAAIAKLHAKNPADRFQSAAEVAQFLAQGLAHVQQPSAKSEPGVIVTREPTSRKPGSRRHRWRHVALLAIAAGVVILSGVTIYVRRETPAQPTVGQGLQASSPDAATALGVFAQRLGAGISNDPRDPAVAALRRELLEYRDQHLGKPEAFQAVRLMARLAWPADALQREQIAPAELAMAGDGDPSLAPGNLVGVLGSGRLTHWSGVAAVAFSPDGQTLASAAHDHAVRLWDANTGRLRLSLKGHIREFWSVRYSPNGKLVVAGSMDGKTRIWDAKTGEVRQALLAHPGSWVMDAVFASDNQTLATGGRDALIKLWDLSRDDSVPRILRGHREGILCMAFAPGDKTLVTGSFDRSVMIWNVHNEEGPKTLSGHSDWVQAVALNKDGTLLASGSRDGTVKIWDLATGAEQQTLRGPGAGIASLAISPDGSTLAAGLDSGLIKVWKMSTWQEGPSWQAHLGAIRGLTFKSDSKTLASGGYYEGGVRLWEAATGKEVDDQTAPRAALTSVAFSPDGATVAAVCRDRTVWVWDVADKSVRRRLRHEQAAAGLAFHPDGLKLAVGTDDGVRLWDLSGAEQPKVFKNFVPVRAVAFSPDGRLIAAAREDGAITLWDVASGEEKEALEGYGKSAPAVAFSPDGRLLAARKADGMAEIYDLAIASKRTLGSAQDGSILAFSPDGKWLCACAGQWNQTVLQWDVVTGQERRVEVAIELQRGLLGVTYSPDGESIAAAGSDGGVRIWEAQTGRPRHSFAVGPPPRSPVYSVAFSPDGRHLASANGNGTVSILRLGAGPK